MPIDLLSYKGDAGLGFGSNPNLAPPVRPDTFDSLIQASRDFSARANENNFILFQQKVKDRDRMMEMIAKDEVSLGNVLPEYVEEINKAKAEQEKAFEEYGKNINNTEAFKKYKDAAQKTKDLATIAQTNTVQISLIRKAAAEEQIPERRKQIESFAQKELERGLTDFVRPYQALLNADFEGLANKIAGISGYVSRGTPQKKGEQKQVSASGAGADVETGGGNLILNEKGEPTGLIKHPDQIDDFDHYQKAAVASYIDPKGEMKAQQDLLIQSIGENDVDKSLELIDLINKRIDQYNKETDGEATPVSKLEQGKDYVVVVDPENGTPRVQIKSPTPEFVAKYSLAMKPGNYFQKGIVEPDKKWSDYLLNNQKIKESMSRMGVARAKANAYIENLNKKTSMLSSQGLSVNEVNDMAHRFLEDPVFGQSVTIVTGEGKNATTTTKDGVNKFYVDKLPSQYRNAIIATDPLKGTVVKEVHPFTDENGRAYLEGEVYNSSSLQVMPTDEKSIRKAYYDKSVAVNKTAQKNKVVPIVESYEKFKENYFNDLKSGINTGAYRVIQKDAMGNRIDLNSVSDAYRFMNNQFSSKKGQQLLFQDEGDPNTGEELNNQ